MRERSYSESEEQRSQGARNGDFPPPFRLTKERVLELWTKTYNTEGKPDWSHILPYYDHNIHFRDSIQEIRGIEAFTAMTERLTKRSKELKMKIVNAVMQGGEPYSHGMGNDHSVQEKPKFRFVWNKPVDPQ